MSDDREFLEMAAKAAGYKFDSTSPFEICIPHKGGDNYCDWNPLNEDDDALQLAVALRIGFDCYVDPALVEHCCAWVNHRNVPKFHRIYEPYGDAPSAATRRAIVRVAAEIGKAMP